MLKDEIAACCKALKLSHNLVENCDKIEAQSHEEYLLKLLRLELEHRDASRKDRLLKNAGFYTIKTFADYIFDEIKLPQGAYTAGPKRLQISRRKEKPDPLRQRGNRQNPSCHSHRCGGL